MHTHYTWSAGGAKVRASQNIPGTVMKRNYVTRELDAFEAGYLRNAVNLWEVLEQRDDLLRTVVSKRKKAAGRHGWTIQTNPNLSAGEKAEAQEHVAALEYFYSHLECGHAVDTAERGGFHLLTRQMMDAVGKRFAVHEIVWRAESGEEWEAARAAGRVTHRRLVSASFRFVPLAFFENTTGWLRLLRNESATEGSVLEEGAWLITVGDGLMTASSVAWMQKQLALDDWLEFCQRNARPVLRGVTAATPGSAEWDTFEEALWTASDGSPVVHGANDDLRVLDMTGGGGLPFPEFVERMDRMMAAIWRGADLSTMSRDRGYGASLQEKESCVLEEDDARMLSEALNRYVDKWVIRHVFGAGVKPLAHVKVLLAPRECTADDLRVDEFLVKHGAPLSLESTLHRYGRTAARGGEAIFGKGSGASTRPESPQAAASDPGEGGFGAEMENRVAVGSPGGSEAGAARLANHGVDGMDAARVSGDEFPFTILQPDWVQLAPYGDFPHARGLQRVDRLAAVQMVANFASFRARAARLFGGAPFYAGHPDLPGASESADQKAYGWITALEAREDGLYGFAKWSDAGRELLRQAHYKYLSPYWEATEIGREGGRVVFRPVALISVGLTNQPNIPVRPLANESAPEDGDCTRLSPERVREAEEALENALRCGRIVPAEEAAWREVLRGDLDLGRSQLEALQPKMHTTSLTAGYGERREELLRFTNRRDRIQEAVARRQQQGLSYDGAWESVKREHPGWFE